MICLDSRQNVLSLDLDDLRVLDGLGREVKFNFIDEHCLEVQPVDNGILWIKWQGRSKPILLTKP